MEPAPVRHAAPDESAFRLMADSAPALIWVTDDQGRLIFANRRYEAVFGRPADDMRGEGWKQIVHPDDVDAFHACFLQAFERREPFTAEVRVRGKDGELIWLRCEGAPRFGAAGEFVGYTGCNVDVTEGRVAESAVRDREERLSAMLNGIWSGFYALDRDWRFTLFNDYCEEYFGLGRGEVVGRTLWERFPAVLGTSIERHFRTAMDRRERVEFERPSVARPDRLVRWRLFPTPEGLGVAIDDVTERREAEQRVRETNERLRALADNLPSGLVYQILCRRDGSDRRFIYVSEACERVTGVTAAAALADPAALMNAFPPDQLQHLAAAEAIALERLEALDVEVAMQRPDGERVWTRIISAPRELDDEYLLWDGIQIDISEQRRAEQARLAAEERGRLAAQAADIGVWDWDPVAQQLRWDLRCKALFGLAPDAPVSNDTFVESLHPEDRSRVAAEIDRALDPNGAGDYDAEYRVVGADGVERWISARGRSLFDDGRAVRFIGAMVDVTQRKLHEVEKARLFDEAQREITERRRAEEHLQLLIHELNHRVKNTLATVQSIAIQTLRRAASPEAAHQAFTQRLIALSKAHDVLTRENWEGAFLHDVVHGAVDPFRSDARERFAVSGPIVRLNPKSALALAMALHELGTNAVKYGALAGESGRVDIGWSRVSGPSSPVLNLVWRELGGPPVKAPDAVGFGSRLIEHGLAAELNGQAAIEYAATGVICTITAPLRP